MLRFALAALLLSSCAPAPPTARPRGGDWLQEDMIANPQNYVPPQAASRQRLKALGLPDPTPASEPAFMPPPAAAPEPAPPPTLGSTPTQQSNRALDPKLTASLLPIYSQAVTREMRDPSSVQFRDLKVGRNTEGGDTLCGELNAKNGYGGYVGFDPFYAEIIPTPDPGRTIATVFPASKVGLRYVLDRCR